SPPTEMGFPHCVGSHFLTLTLASGQVEPGADSGCIGELYVAPDSAALVATHYSGAPGSWVENVNLATGETTQITQPTEDLPFSNGGTVTLDNETLAYIAHRSFDGTIPTDLVL